jgi:hypothetical protein
VYLTDNLYRLSIEQTAAFLHQLDTLQQDETQILRGVFKERISHRDGTHNGVRIMMVFLIECFNQLYSLDLIDVVQNFITYNIFQMQLIHLVLSFTAE